MKEIILNWVKEDFFNRWRCTIRNNFEPGEKRLLQQVEVHYKKYFSTRWEKKYYFKWRCNIRNNLESSGVKNPTISTSGGAL